MAQSNSWTLGELAQLVGGELQGPSDLVIKRPVPANEDDPEGIGFAENETYLVNAESSNVGALFLSKSIRETSKPNIRVDIPRMAFGMLLGLSNRELGFEPGIHPTAIIHPTATVSPQANIGPYAVIEREAIVESKARVYPFAYIGDRCTVKEGAQIMPHAVLVMNVTIGANSIVHSGAVLGADGFGFVWDGSEHRKVPQVGQVIVGTNAEVGANTTVDRATAGSTRIGTGTKIDNLVQVGHNCQIGSHTVIAGMCGISGSTKIGNNVVMGGGVGTNDHISIGDNVILGGRTGVDKDITEPGQYFGTPARPAGEALRTFLIIPKLPEIYSRLKKVEKKVGL